MKVVDNIYIEKINLSTLEKCLIKFKECSKYLIDGIIIRHNENYEFNKSGNPDYAFAFKMVLNNQIKETVIKNTLEYIKIWKIISSNRSRKNKHRWNRYIIHKW